MAEKKNYFANFMHSLFLFLTVCITNSLLAQGPSKISRQELAQKILQDKTLSKVDSMGRTLFLKGFNAGSGYSQVWIRDLNTFIDVAMTTRDTRDIRGALLVFFALQQPNNEIVDGYVLKKDFTWGDNHPYYSDLDKEHVGFKNTVETDQETSLIQAVAKYIAYTKDSSILHESIGGKTVLQRLYLSVDYLMNERYNKKYGLLWGAMTADWGDVQPNTDNVVDIDSTTTPAIDIYDNAMMIIALDKLAGISTRKQDVERLKNLRNIFFTNARTYLWDTKKQKFIPHIYIDKSPIPSGFDESKVYYHGGTTIAIEAGLLNKKEIAASNKQMLEDVRLSGAPTVGLTIYPVYPQGFFHGGMANPYVYQNGGDWPWFGGRTIQQLVKNGFIQEAYDELKPMVDLVLKYNDFYEWYGIDGKPQGSAHFKGSAGALCKAIEMMQDWAKANK
jgi:hypothetical protein